MSETSQDESHTSCPLCKFHDQSPAACLARTTKLRDTIPAEVAEQAQGPVLSVTCCAGRFMVRTVTPEPGKAVLLDGAIRWLANAHPYGVVSGEIVFCDSKIRFADGKFKDFVPAPTRVVV